MIDDIKLIGINDNQMDELIEKLGYDKVLNMACNHELIKENIDLLNSYGLKNIYELLLNKEYIFFIDTQELKEKFNRPDIIQMVDLINNGYLFIDDIL